jgi:hypothetical protein
MQSRLGDSADQVAASQKNRCERIKIKASISILQFLVGQMAQEDGPPHLSFGGLPGRPQGNLGGILGGPIIYIYNRILGTKPPISHYTPLESSQDFPEGFLEGLQSLHAGLILGEFLSTKKQETMPYDDSSKSISTIRLYHIWS